MGRLIPRPLDAGRRATGAIQAIACIVALSRGLDYMMPSTRNIQSLGFVEAAAPLYVWGAFLVAAVALVGAGLVSDRLGVVALGHLTAACIYAAVGIGQLAAVLPQYGLDGFRTGFGLFLGGGGLHTILAWTAWAAYRDGKVYRAIHIP